GGGGGGGRGWGGRWRGRGRWGWSATAASSCASAPARSSSRRCRHERTSGGGRSPPKAGDATLEASPASRPGARPPQRESGAKMTDVVLVTMPWGILGSPSLALGTPHQLLLHARLAVASRSPKPRRVGPL